MAAHVLHQTGMAELDVRSSVARALDAIAAGGGTGENQHWLAAIDDPASSESGAAVP